MVGELLESDPDDTLEDFLQGYLPATRTEHQAEERAVAVETLIRTPEKAGGDRDTNEDEAK
jgi:hypothetical protein